MLLNSHAWGEEGAAALVCIHGVTGHALRFQKLAKERLAASHRVVAVDLRGHGHSGWEPPWDGDTHVGDLLETADALGIGRATWLGFSFGGRLAAELALRAPERVERLVLLDPALQLPPERAHEAAEEECRPQTFASPDEAIEARYAAGTLISTPRELLEEEMRQHLVPAAGDGRLAYRYSRPAAVAAWSEMARPAPGVADVPTLLVLGSESFVPNEAQPERYRAALGERFEQHVITSGHSLLWDAFEDTAALLADWLLSGPASAARASP